MISPQEARTITDVERCQRLVLIPADLSLCWEWLGCRTSSGYGVLSIKNRQHKAHRFVYETLVGPIPDGIVLDHLCRNRGCVNVWHLEPVTNAENMRRQVPSPMAGAQASATVKRALTHCKNGHQFTSENTYWRRDGGRECRSCHAEREQRRRTARHSRPS